MRLRFIPMVLAAVMSAAACPVLAGATHAAATTSRIVAAPTAQGPTGPGGTWGLSQGIDATGLEPAVSITRTSISCSAAGECGAIGGYSPQASTSIEEDFVLSETGGVWGQAQPVPGLAALNTGRQVNGWTISCAAPGDCAATGGYASRDSAKSAIVWDVFVVSQVNGVWGKAQKVDTSGLGGATAFSAGPISCPSPGYCTATGNFWTGPSEFESYVLTETNGAWGAAQTVPGLSALKAPGSGYATITGMSCGSAGDCVAGGAYSYNKAWDSAAFIVEEKGGTWESAETVPGMAALSTFGSAVDNVSCSAAGDCTVAGSYLIPQGGSDQPPLFVVSETDGTWGDAATVPGTLAGPPHDFLPVQVSCSSPGDCTIAGNYLDRSERNYVYVATETGGIWGDAESVPGLPAGSSNLSSLTCTSAGNCIVGGYYSGNSLPGYANAYIASETDGTWGPAKLIAGAAPKNSGTRVGTISCGSAGYCAATLFSDGAAGEHAYLVNEATIVGIVLSLTEPLQLTYGHEQLESVLAGVASPAGGTPTGTVTVTLGGRRACTITLAAGEGSCSPAPTSVPVGSYPLTVSYSGDTTYVNSASTWLFPIAVVKATTTTRLSVAKAAVTYGREGAGRLTVAVAPRYAGTPTGKVTIRAGKTTVCVITLTAGKGSCTLTARQLKAGTYALVASYGGSADYDKSTATRKTLRVVT